MEKCTTLHTIIRITLKELRLQRQVQQAQINVALGKTGSTWSKVENAESDLSLDHLLTACQVCQVWPSDLLQTAQTYMNVFQQCGWFVSTNQSALPKADDLLSKMADEFYAFQAKNSSPMPAWGGFQVLQTPWPYANHYAPLDVFRWATDDNWRSTKLQPNIPPPPPPAPPLPGNF